MAIRFRRVQRLCDPTNKDLGKKVYPSISYQYDTPATLEEFAKEISITSGTSEGTSFSVLKDFRTLLRKKTACRSFGEHQRIGVLFPFRPKQRCGKDGGFYHG